MLKVVCVSRKVKIDLQDQHYRENIGAWCAGMNNTALVWKNQGEKAGQRYINKSKISPLAAERAEPTTKINREKSVQDFAQSRISFDSSPLL